MKLRQWIFEVAFAFSSSAAIAFQRPADMKKIDAAMAKNPKLSEAQLSEAKKLRADGEAAHKVGKHLDAVDTLAETMKILGV